MTDSSTRRIPLFLRHFHKIIYFIEDLGAIDEANAVPFAKFEKIINIELGPNRRKKGRIYAYNRLLKKSVILKTANDLFYVDLGEFEEFKKWYVVLNTSIYIPLFIFLLLGVAWILTAT
jgi:hypothetical protein